jgi:hypothetical protein
MDVPDQDSVLVDDFKFHITVMYSKVAHNKFMDGEYDIYPFTLKPESLQMFGPNNDILAIKLRQEKLFKNLFDYYCNSYGHISDFPCNPHVSIRGSSEDYKDRIRSIPLPDFNLVVNKLIHKVDGWMLGEGKCSMTGTASGLISMA